MNLIKNQAGQSLVEYLVIVSIVAIGAIGIMRVVGQTVNVKFAHVAESLGADVEGDISRSRVTKTLHQKKDLKDFMDGAK